MKWNISIISIFILLILLIIYDGLTTFYIMNHYGIELEVNPLIKFLMKNFGIFNGIFYIKLLSGIFLGITTILCIIDKNIKIKIIYLYSLFGVSIFYSVIMISCNYQIIRLMT